MGRFHFIPDGRCIGGAHQIDAEVFNMQKKIYEASSSIDCWQGANSEKRRGFNMADRLSINRQRRRAMTDLTMMNHCDNLFHLQRRIAEQSSYTERKKNAFDADVYPVRIHRRFSKSSRKIDSRPASARLNYEQRKNRPRSSRGVSSDTLFSLFRDSILRTIAAEDQPTELRVKQILDSYILETPLEHQEVLLSVIQYISKELGI